MDKDKTYIGIDTGDIKSALVILRGQEVIEKIIKPNKDLSVDLETISKVFKDAKLAIEMFQGRGKKAGQESFDSIFYVGWFARVWVERAKTTPVMIYRSEVKRHLCGTTAVNDSNVRQAILDLYPKTGGGKVPQVGVKAKKGPLFGISNDMYSALGICLTVQSGEYGRARVKL